MVDRTTQLRPALVSFHFAMLALLTLLAVAGCGSDDSSDTNGVESKPAGEILNETAAALKRVKSLRLQGTETIDNRRTAVKADLERPAKIRLSFDQGGAAAEIVAVGGVTYMKANAAFWRREVERSAEKLAGRWIKIPTSGADLRDLTRGLQPATLSRCLLLNHGSLSKGGKATVNGQPAVVIIDKGDRPGTSAGKLFVATTGEPLPLRVVVTGKQRPGGPRDRDCNDPSSESKPGDQLTLSRYNESLKIAAPPGAVDFTPPTGTAS